MSFDKSYSQICGTVQEELEKLNAELEKSVCGDTPLHSAVRDFLLAPSKRIRPLVVFLYLKANKIEVSNAHIKLQTVTELIHNASLIHDDVIDNGKLRRSKQTINSAFNNRLAVISGDYILSVTLRKLAEFNSPELIKIYSSVIEKMCTGEIEQNFSRYKITDIAKYIEKSYKKTGALFESALKASIFLEGLPPENAEFAKFFGIAFQIRDDLLNITGQDNTKVSADIQDGIYNAPVIFSGSADNPSAGIEKTKSLLSNYIERAKQKISNLENNRYKRAMTELLDILKNE